jgi:hypothetical protein
VTVYFRDPVDVLKDQRSPYQKFVELPEHEAVRKWRKRRCVKTGNRGHLNINDIETKATEV